MDRRVFLIVLDSFGIDMAKLIEMFRQGGPVMWPILALSVIGLAILIWKAMEFRAGRKDGRGRTWTGGEW